jgi:hypothetical protein
MSGKTMTMLAVGDLVLNSRFEEQFALVAPVLRSADVAVTQLETVFTNRGTPMWMETPLPGADPANLEGLSSTGLDIITLAGNHCWDQGVPGVEDTINGIRGLGIATVGTGMNIDEAKTPAIIDRDGTRFGFLSYNCVGPREAEARPNKAGSANVDIISHYELDFFSPGSPPKAYTFAEPDDLKAMEDDIRKLRPLCDVLVVALHKGMMFTPVKLAMYEQPVSYAAIDAGADLIVSHHPGIIKGVEQYKGKAIFHGLGSFAKSAPLFLTLPGTPPPRPWIRPEWHEPWHDRLGELLIAPELKYTMIAKCTIDGKKGISRLTFLPCIINGQGQPEIFKNDERGQQVFDYVDKITREAGLNARYEWEGDEVVIHTE